MNNWNNILILGGIIGGYFLVLIIAKNIYSGRLAKAMARGDEFEAKKLLYSNVAIFLLNHQMLSLMRASFKTAEENYEEAKRYLGMIKVGKLSLEQKMSYYVIQMQIALATKDVELAQEVQNDLRVLYDIEKKPEIKDVMDDNEIQIALILDYDPSIIEKLDVRVKTCKNKDEKGLLLVNLAKAYHLNHQDDEAIACLKRATEYVSNELTLKVIHAALKDTSVLG